MRFMLIIIGIAAALLTSCESQQEATAEQAGEIARNILILDSHIDIPYQMRREFIDLSIRREEGHFDYVRAREGGLNVPFIAAY
ncbi:MAG: membrane dipeptidase, partial [Calditrichaeota bacterium]